MRNKAELQKRGLKSWNFRLVKWDIGDRVTFVDNETTKRKISEPLESPVFSVHEIFYDDNGNPCAMTEDGVLYDFFDNEEDAVETLKRMTDDCQNQETLHAKDLRNFFQNDENK